MSLQGKKKISTSVLDRPISTRVISGRHKNEYLIFYSCQLRLAHITTDDRYERSSGFYSTGIAPPDLGLTFKSKSQTYHSYSKLAELKF